MRPRPTRQDRRLRPRPEGIRPTASCPVGRVSDEALRDGELFLDVARSPELTAVVQAYNCFDLPELMRFSEMLA